MGSPAPHSVQKRLNAFLRSLPISYAPDMITEPLSIAVALLRKHPEVLTRLRPHLGVSSVPWMPAPLYHLPHGDDLSALTQSHGIYLCVVFRLHILEQMLQECPALPPDIRRMVIWWRCAHVPLVLYLDSQVGQDYSDEPLLAFNVGIHDIPRDRYSPGPPSIFTAENTLPRLCRELLDCYTAIFPGTVHPHFTLAQQPTTPIQMLWTVVSKLMPGRCLRRGCKELMSTPTNWILLYHNIRLAVGCMLLNGYHDSEETPTFRTQLLIVQRFFVYGCGGAEPTTGGCEAMRKWFMGSIKAQELVYAALQRFLLFQLEALPVLYEVAQEFYQQINENTFSKFEAHVLMSSTRIFAHINAHESLDAVETLPDISYTGAKLPKQTTTTSVIRVRDVDPMIGVEQCTDVQGLSVELFMLINWAVHVKRYDICTVLELVTPMDDVDADVWKNSLCPLVKRALAARKKEGLTTLATLQQTPLGHRMLHILRNLLSHEAVKNIEVVSLPMGDWMRQVVALHASWGQARPVQPVLGTKEPEPVDYCPCSLCTDTYKDDVVAIREAQSILRRALVRNVWWDVSLPAYYCPVCTQFQMPPRQRVLYVPCTDDNGCVCSFAVTCGSARKTRRSDAFKRRRGEQRVPNFGKNARNQLMAAWCDSVPLCTFNMLGTGVFIDKKLFQACCKCATVSVVDPRLWTSGDFFTCVNCNSAERRFTDVPRCMRCGRPGYKSSRTTELHSWAQRPIRYLNLQKHWDDGFICSEGSCDGEKWHRICAMYPVPVQDIVSRTIRVGITRDNRVFTRQKLFTGAHKSHPYYTKHKS